MSLLVAHVLVAVGVEDVPRILLGLKLIDARHGVVQAAAVIRAEGLGNHAQGEDIAGLVDVSLHGGGAGVGAAAVEAEIAKSRGILTVGVVTKPFSFEGRRRMDQAMKGIEELQSKVDSLVIIPNDRLQYATDEKITFANAFAIADDVLRQAVQSISDLITTTGLINLDFADVTAVMKDAGLAHMGVGRAAGKNRAEEATRLAINSPLLETSIQGAKGIIVNITGPMDIGLDEVEVAAEMVKEVADPDALFMMGAAFDDSLQDEIRVTVIATGFGGVSNPTPGKEETEQPTEKEKDPFDDIFQIFQNK